MRTETPVDPHIPIIDAHHRLYDHPSALVERVMRRPRFFIEDYVDRVSEGHNVVASVVVASQSMYRADGPDHLRVVGDRVVRTSPSRWADSAPPVWVRHLLCRSAREFRNPCRGVQAIRGANGRTFRGGPHHIRKELSH